MTPQPDRQLKVKGSVYYRHDPRCRTLVTFHETDDYVEFLPFWTDADLGDENDADERPATW